MRFTTSTIQAITSVDGLEHEQLICLGLINYSSKQQILYIDIL